MDRLLKPKWRRPKRKFAKLILLSVKLSPVLLCVACNTAQAVTGCSELARGVLTTPEAHPVIGDSGDADLDWKLLGTAYAGVLDKSNDRALTGFNIIQQCELRDAEIRKQIERSIRLPF